MRILGIDVGRVWLMVFGIGTGLAALAGLLAAPLQGASPEMGDSVLAIAFVVTWWAAWAPSSAPCWPGCWSAWW